MLREAVSGEDEGFARPIAAPWTESFDDPESPETLPSRWPERLLVAAVVVVALLWIAAIAASAIMPSGSAAPLATSVAAVAAASGPLALLGIGWLLAQRTSRREAHRFGETSRAMRAEARNLERVLSDLSTRIDDNRKALAEHGHQLLLLGEDSTARLAEIATTMRVETAALAIHSEKLERAASAARTDMAVLLNDAPKIDGQIRELSAVLREAGVGAHEQAGALEAQLAVLAARGREADDQAGGAAQRLAAHLARIEGTVENAGRQMDVAAGRMSAAIDVALVGASEAIDQTRRGVDAQSAALLAMVERSAAAMDHAGTEAAVALGRRIDEIGGRIDGLATRIREQDAASRALLASLDEGLDEVEQRFAVLGEIGDAHTTELSTALDALRAHTERVTASLAGSDDQAAALTARVDAMRATLAASRGELDDALPASIARIEEQAERGRAAIAAAMPAVERFEASIGAAAGQLADADAILIRQRTTLDGIRDDAVARLAEIERQGEAVAALFERTGEEGRALAESAGPQLVEMLLRVRETAQQAAERAREALTAVIPEAAASLGEASRAAMERAFDERVEQQMASISAASDRAVQAAALASERLMRQMLTIADTTSAIEARIAEHRTVAAAGDEDLLSRRVALLIESLNSTAIDVTKILSNDVTDSAWTAYLKGDRSVFTRRAVRLIDSADAKEIMRHYEEEPEFRNQVNRYIHDFEGMLRRVLASRDGAPLSVTLLSSDMGKLYVALAQAIERLRT